MRLVSGTSSWWFPSKTKRKPQWKPRRRLLFSWDRSQSQASVLQAPTSPKQLSPPATRSHGTSWDRVSCTTSHLKAVGAVHIAKKRRLLSFLPLVMGVLAKESIRRSDSLLGLVPGSRQAVGQWTRWGMGEPRLWALLQQVSCQKQRSNQTFASQNTLLVLSKK